MEEKIAVLIAAYCDSEELYNTVNSALAQADKPKRVNFLICYQDDDLKVYESLSKFSNCKMKHLKIAESKGLCFARYICEQMIEDEKYIYQIDSHMRFVKHWDTKMISMLLSLNDDMASISFYPPALSEEMLTLPFRDKAFDEPSSGGAMYVDNFRDEKTNFLQQQGYIINNDDPRAFKKNPFISGGNFFSFSNILKIVRHDPAMYFYGDELPMAIRLFTYGLNNYVVGESYIYHLYYRKNQKFSSVPDAMKLEEDRFKQLLNLDNNHLDIGEFGFGTVRTLHDFELFSGIDFKNRIISNKAKEGLFDT